MANKTNRDANRTDREAYDYSLLHVPVMEESFQFSDDLTEDPIYQGKYFDSEEWEEIMAEHSRWPNG